MIWLCLAAFELVAQDQLIYRIEWGASSEGRKAYFISDNSKARSLTDSLAGVKRQEGYLEGLFSETLRGDTLVMTWESGPLFSWTAVGSGTVPSEYMRQLGKPKLEYPEPYRWMGKVLELAEDDGYPFAQIQMDSLKIDGNLLSGVVDFETGPRITWDSVSVVGETKTSERYLQQLSGLVPGSIFSQKALDQATDALRRSPYFTLNGAPELTFQIRNATPIFSLRDRKVNVFDGVIGFLPNENEPGKMLITGEVDLQLYHLGGKGRDFSVNWQRLNIQSQALDIRAKESFIFRSPIDLGAGFSLLRQDSSFVNRTFELDFGYRMNQNAYATFFTKRQAGDLIDTDGGMEEEMLPDAIDYRWNQYGLGLDFDTQDSPTSPRRGGRVQGQFSLGNKRIIQNTGLPEELYEGLEDASPQYQAWVSAEKHFFFKPIWGMWLRGVGGWVQNDNLFLNELYRLGGLKSIRGFNEKFFFAKTYTYVNIEQRLFFGQNSYLVVFSDLGWIQNPFASKINDRPISFGTGINLDTDGGLFSFVLALGKSNSQPMSFSYSRIHFGYLARF